jgi:hypothetical protein
MRIHLPGSLGFHHAVGLPVERIRALEGAAGELDVGRPAALRELCLLHYPNWSNAYVQAEVEVDRGLLNAWFEAWLGQPGLAEWVSRARQKQAGPGERVLLPAMVAARLEGKPRARALPLAGQDSGALQLLRLLAGEDHLDSPPPPRADAPEDELWTQALRFSQPPFPQNLGLAGFYGVLGDDAPFAIGRALHTPAAASGGLAAALHVVDGQALLDLSEDAARWRPDPELWAEALTLVEGPLGTTDDVAVRAEFDRKCQVFAAACRELGRNEGAILQSVRGRLM